MQKATIQRILQQHGPQVVAKGSLPLSGLQAIEKLSQCRTAALGGHAQYCENNHLNGIWYNSCKHRACPQCRGMATEEWLLNTKRVLLDCPHHHVIFTFPASLNTLWRYNQRVMTDLLFRAAQQTLKQFAKDKRYLGASPGMLSALHTWGRNLSLHPHLHLLISHGGINAEGDWVTPKKTSLFPQKPVMMVFRGKLLALIKTAMNAEGWQTPPDQTPRQIQNRLNKLGRQAWVVHFCDRYDYAEGVAKYLSRYVKSGPLKNSQIYTMDDTHVSFHYQSHQTKKRERLRLTTDGFIHRLIQHTPLPGKPTVRYGGLYNSAARKKLNRAREALGQIPVSERQQLRWQTFLETKGSLPRCTQCGEALSKMVNILPLHRQG